MPKKRKTKTEELACSVDGCDELPLFDGQCAAHWTASKAVDFAKEKMETGDWFSALLGMAGMVTAQASQPMIQRISHDLARAANGQPVQNPFRSSHSGPPPKPPPMNPWPILGLDPRTATSSDVKMMQRKLAELYHPDKAVKGVSSDALKIVNQAADIALKYLKQQKR